MSVVEIGGISIHVTKKPIKNTHLSVHPPEGRVTIACPADTKDETIRLYLTSKIGWIRRQQKMFQEKDRQCARRFVTGETHYLFGRPYRLKVISCEGRPRLEIRTKSIIEMYTPLNASQQTKQEVIKEYNRIRLKEVLEEMIEKWSSKMEVAPVKWQVKEMKTKWGSCNTEKGTLLFNLELAKKPKSCIEYIVVHELVHLLERLHNDRFVSYMDRHLPMWRRRKEELNSLPVAHRNWGY